MKVNPKKSGRVGDMALRYYRNFMEILKTASTFAVKMEGRSL